jgi:hypothetical protein
MGKRTSHSRPSFAQKEHVGLSTHASASTKTSNTYPPCISAVTAYHIDQRSPSQALYWSVLALRTPAMRLLAVRRPGFPRTFVRLRVFVRHPREPNPGWSESGAGHASLCWPRFGGDGWSGLVGCLGGGCRPGSTWAPQIGQRADRLPLADGPRRRSQRCCGAGII